MPTALSAAPESRAESGHSPLVERLQRAAVESIANVARALDADVGRLKSITLELELANNGAVVDSRCFLERRSVHRGGGAR